MPYLKINTNQKLDNDSEVELASAASPLLAKMLGKPESYIMIEVHSGVSMQFAGSTEPLAYLELKSIGLPEDKTQDLSLALCALIHENLGIDTDRIYIEFANADRHMWGWNSGTF